jgi:hypothetical protein
MSNDLENIHQSGSELAPYSPSQPLAPAPSPDTWGNNTQLTNREIDEYTEYSGGGQMVFGQPLPAGVTLEQVTQGFAQLSGVFVSDFAQLGHPHGYTQKAVEWFMKALTNPPKPTQKRHSYNLYEHTSDPTFQAFANFAHDWKFPAKFVRDACWWVTEAAKKLGESQGEPAHGRAPSTSGRPDDLDTATYNALYDYNEKMRPKTEAILHAKWGDAYEANRRMVDEYQLGLSAVERQHFDRFLNNGLHAMNDPTVIMGLYEQAIGVNSIPKSGPALQDEINAMQAVMRTHRKQWLSDERMQSRYRYLLDLQTKGR